MALSQSDFVSAVARLNDLTRRKIIKWSPSRSVPREPEVSLPTTLADRFMPLQFKPKLSFEATYDRRILRITQYEATTTSLYSSSYRYVLDVRNEDGDVKFQFPNVEGIEDLFRSVQTPGLDIEGSIKGLVAE